MMPNGTTDEWEKDWRTKVDAKLDTLTGLVQGLVSRVVTTEQAVADMRRGPAEARDTVNVAGVVATALVAVAALLATMACSGLSVLIALYKVVHP